MVANADFDVVTELACRDFNVAASRRVLGRVLQQVAEDPFDQYRIEFQQRQIGRQRDAHRVRRQRIAEQLDAGADDLFERLPLAAQGDVAGVQPRHVEQVADQAGQPGSLFVHGLRGFQGGRRQGRLDQEQRVGEPDQRGQRRAQIVREGGKDRAAQPFRNHVELRGVRHIDVMQALDGDGDQRCQRFEQGEVFRRQIG